MNALKVQMSSSTDYLIPNQSPTGIGCGDKTEQFFQFNDVAVFNLTIQNITGELCEIQFFGKLFKFLFVLFNPTLNGNF